MGHLLKTLSLAAALLALARPVPAEALTIVNHHEDQTWFSTSASDSVGLFSATHTLIDIPGTPWVNSSTIVETNGPPGGADSVNVTWTSQHIVGPDADDIDPNAAVTLTLSFTPTAAGIFSIHSDPLPLTRLEIPHPRLNNQFHYDRFVLDINHAVVTSTLLGGFDIESYEVVYFAVHCDVPLNPDFICFTPPVDLNQGLLLIAADDVGFEETPWPATLLLCVAGCLAAGLSTVRARPR